MSKVLIDEGFNVIYLLLLLRSSLPTYRGETFLRWKWLIDMSIEHHIMIYYVVNGITRLALHAASLTLMTWQGKNMRAFQFNNRSESFFPSEKLCRRWKYKKEFRYKTCRLWRRTWRRGLKWLAVTSACEGSWVEVIWYRIDWIRRTCRDFGYEKEIRKQLRSNLNFYDFDGKFSVAVKLQR